MKHAVIILLIPFLNACTAIGIDNGPISTFKLLVGPPIDASTYAGREVTYNAYDRYVWDLKHDQAKPMAFYHFPNGIRNQSDWDQQRLKQMSRKKIHSHRVGSNGSTYSTYSHTYSGGTERPMRWDSLTQSFRKKYYHED